MLLNNAQLLFDARGVAGLTGLNLELVPGEILAVMGASGAGKSTLLRVLSGELQLQAGEARFTGNTSAMLATLPDTPLNVQAWLINSIRRQMPEEKKLQLARDVAQDLEFPTQLKRRLTELSEGQRQRVRLAHALIDQPDWLLLDEPFAHLDSPLRQELCQLLRGYVKPREIGVVWVTHEAHEALGYADRVGVMQYGRFEQVGTPEELYQRPRNLVVARLLGHENFFPITRLSPDSWQTPFGVWTASGFAANKEHAVLCLPPQAFRSHEQGPLSATVTHCLFQGPFYQLSMEWGEWRWKMPGPRRQPGENQRFSVILPEGLGIDCL